MIIADKEAVGLMIRCYNLFHEHRPDFYESNSLSDLPPDAVMTVVRNAVDRGIMPAGVFEEIKREHDEWKQGKRSRSDEGEPLDLPTPRGAPPAREWKTNYSSIADLARACRLNHTSQVNLT